MTITKLTTLDGVRGAYLRQFGEAPALVARAPGRVNLIGEHTDYNGGFVFPMAITRQALVAMGPAKGPDIQVRSVQFAESDTFSPDLIEPAGGGWRDYVRGVVAIATKLGLQARPCNMVIDGDVPLGSGLSSSAALEVAVFTALNAFNGWELPLLDIAKLSQRAENDFVGVNCGIMDQLISVFGREDCALLVDCRSLEHRPVPLGLSKGGVQVAIIDSEVPRTLATAGYNQRRQECEAGVALLASALGRPLDTLRDVSRQEFEANQEVLPQPVRARVRHVISENERVLRAVEALERGDMDEFGALMSQSHASLRDDYEVSCSELDLIVDLATKVPGVLGARMTGAGFGGCAVALVRDDSLGSLTQAMDQYMRQTGLTPTVWLCKAAPGASVLQP